MSILNTIALMVIVMFYASFMYLISFKNYKCSGTRTHCKKEYYKMDRAQKDPQKGESK